MNRVRMRRTYDADESAVRSLVTDVEPFMRAGGFDEVHLAGDRLQLRNSVGIATLELDLRLVDGDAALEYVQEDGIFSEMTTRYTVETGADGTDLVATTDYALDVALVGGLLDATVIDRQRRKEIESQFAYVADRLG